MRAPELQIQKRHLGNSQLVEGRVKITACTACGHVRQVSHPGTPGCGPQCRNEDHHVDPVPAEDPEKAGLCGRGSCIKRRTKGDVTDGT